MEATFLGALMDKMAQSVPSPPDGEYMGDDGLLHCRNCHSATQFRSVVPALGIDRTVRCICKCGKERLDEEEREAQRFEREKQRRTCFAESNMASWTFENDDRQNPKLSDAMLRYTQNFPQFRREGKGLLLYGTVGTGKTYYAACIANRLLDNGTPCLMTNFARLTNQIQGTFEGKQEYIDGLNRYSLLIIDDLGAERQSEFMQEMVFNIIDARYRSGLPLIITTNLTADEIKKPQEVRYQRIYDRILERCFPIEVSGVSRRRMAVRDTYGETKALLGL